MTLETLQTVLTSMPIDIETFTTSDDEELTEVTNAERVVQFLYRNDDKAFTASEIAEATSVKKTSIGTVLRRLRERDLLRHKGDYWAIGDKQAVRDAFRFHQTMDALNEQFGAEDLEEWRDHAVTDDSK